jgi:hypothetical protein
VEWAGMALDDVFAHNQNPNHIVHVIRSHPNVFSNWGVTFP